MAFDAGMMAAVAAELAPLVGYRIDKIHMPEKEELVLLLHGNREGKRLLISLAGFPRIHLTETVKENPQVPPTFCMQLRRHLTGARLVSVEQQGFDRVLKLNFETRDEMGYTCLRALMVEIMGKCSNVIFCDGDGKVLGALKLVDLTTSRKRQVLPGMQYELPPGEPRIDPRTETRDAFLSAFADRTRETEKWFLSRYDGLSPLVVRELLHCAGEEPTALWEAFFALIIRLQTGDYLPTMLVSEDGAPIEYAYFPVTQYGTGATVQRFDSAGAMLDAFYGARAAQAHMKQRAADITQLLTQATKRLTRKLELHRTELAACADKDTYKLYGDLITYNAYAVKRGMTVVTLPDYTVDPPASVQVPLDARLTPMQNAQRYYKRYAKAKTAERILVELIENAEAELRYLATVEESLSRAEGEADLAEIRAELSFCGVVGKKQTKKQAKRPPSKPLAFVTTNGYRVLCGKNNLQNDVLTTKQAGKNDWWFHVKDGHGAHVILFAEETEPPEQDFTDAAMIAAYYSDARAGAQVAVDYALARYVKKPAGSKPGFVIYSHNYTAYVTPDEAHVIAQRRS